MSWARTAAARAGALGLAAGAMGIGVAHAAADDKYFDPEALERGAKALREIQSSPFAKKVRLGSLPPPPPPAGCLRRARLPAPSLAAPPSAAPHAMSHRCLSRSRRRSRLSRRS